MFGVVHYGVQDGLDFAPNGGDEGGEDLAHIRNHREGKGNANDGEKDAKCAAGGSHWSHITVA